MMRRLKTILGVLFLFFESIKGARTFQEIRSPKNALGHLTGYAVSGYRINIYCQRMNYWRTYSAWFAADKDYNTYRVWCAVTNDAPEVLRKACELDIVLPGLLPRFISDEDQRSAVVNAYLDILIAKLSQ